jgi:glycosyltransferase involved in cell wall biosynthesis
MKVAIVCDWLIGVGGAERVVLELHNLYPDAPIYTSQYDPSKIDWFKDADVRTGWLQKLPKSLRKFLPALRAWYFSHLDLSDYDLIISSSGAEAKGVRTAPKQTWVTRLRSRRGDDEQRTETYEQYEEGAAESATKNRPKSSARVAGSAGQQGATPRRPMHICYMHSPTHYYWIRYDEYLKNPGFGKLDFLARVGLKILVGPLRRWDHSAAQRPTHIIANSTHTQNMIKKFYGRDSTVVFPPVDTKRFSALTPSPAMEVTGPASQNITTQTRAGFVTAGRQTPYKRIDLPVQACTNLELPLVVIGNGPEHRKLERMAGKSVTFLTGKSDEEVAHYFQTALAFIFPNMDDFGIVAVEALAAGTPVIAYKAGGALDYIIEGKTGLFFDKQDVSSLEKVLKDFNPDRFNSSEIQKYADKFSIANFAKNMREFINSKGRN